MEGGETKEEEPPAETAESKGEDEEKKEKGEETTEKGEEKKEKEEEKKEKGEEKKEKGEEGGEEEGEGGAGGEEEEEEEAVVQLTEFEKIEQSYRNVYNHLEQMEEMETVTQEYKTLYEAYYNAHFHEEDLTIENEALNQKIEVLDVQLSTAETLTAHDKEVIERLKREIEQTWKMVDSAHAREENAQEVVENLRQQINRIINEMEQRAKLGLDQGEEAPSAKKERDNFLRERERLLQELSICKERLANSLTVQEDLERKTSAADLRLNELKQELDNQTNETSKELRLRERLQGEVQDLTASTTDKAAEITRLKGLANQNERTIGKLESSVKNLKSNNEQLQRDAEHLTNRCNKMQTEHEVLNDMMDKMTQEAAAKSQKLKEQDAELTKLNGEASKVEKVREQLTKRYTNAERQRSDLEIERNKLKGNVSQLEKDLDTAKKHIENDKKVIGGLEYEREILNKNMLKAAAAAYEQQKLMRLHDQVRKNLEIEVDSLKFEASKQSKFISNVEKERDRYVMESQDLAQKVQETLDEVKLKQVAIFDFKKKLTEADTKSRMQQNLFEAVRSDRNTLSKLLLEAQDEISELKHKLKVMTHQIEQLKEDITTKETQLMKEQNALQKSEKEKECVKVELRKVRDELRDSKEYIISLNMEARKLNKIIQDADEERQRMKKEMDQIMNERDILGTQLVRRNDELSLLYEKIRILQTTLHRGEAQYDQRLDDIRLLKLEIKRLRQEKNLLSRSIMNMTDMRREIFHLERDLTREKLKCRALEEELQNPLNIHRWRKLEGSDPTTYELIQKIQLLQKRMLVQAKMSIKQDAVVQETERLYLNMRELLANQPGPEVTIRLTETQRALKDRGRKMKCLISELSMYESQISEYKYDLNKVNEELVGVKKKYFAQKKRGEKQKEREREILKYTMPPINNDSKNRFMGGGFNLAAVPTKSVEDQS